jgi:hypothetical protein
VCYSSVFRLIQVVRFYSPPIEIGASDAKSAYAD